MVVCLGDLGLCAHWESDLGPVHEFLCWLGAWDAYLRFVAFSSDAQATSANKKVMGQKNSLALGYIIETSSWRHGLPCNRQWVPPQTLRSKPLQTIFSRWFLQHFCLDESVVRNKLYHARVASPMNVVWGDYHVPTRDVAQISRSWGPPR